MLRITLRPSRRLGAVLIAAHAAAAVTLLPLDLPAWAKGIVAVLAAMSLWRVLRRHAALRSSDALTAIELLGQDLAAVETRAGQRREARILPTTYVSPLLCVLNLRVAGRLLPQHALIVADNVDADSFRRLRVLLRWDYHSPG
jgi:toxin CptA